MSKLLKIIGRSAGISAEWMLIFFLFFVFAIRTYTVQTFIAKEYAAHLSEELGTEVKIEAVEFIFFDRVLLKNFSIKDRNNVNLIKMEEALAKMDHFAFFQESLHIKHISLKKGEINVSRDKTTGEFNYQFVLDYFSDPDEEKDEPLELNIDLIQLSDVEFRYDDYRESVQETGIDFNHIAVKGLETRLSDFRIDGEVYSFDLDHLSCVERSGFLLKDFSSKVVLREGKIRLDDLRIRSAISDIRAGHFELNFNSWDDFDLFEQNVGFKVQMDSSLISLMELAVFVPELQGMNSELTVKATVSDPINQLKINDLDLRFGERSFIRGDLHLPDFGSDSSKQFQQFLSSAFIDLNDVRELKMPDGVDPIELDPSLSQNKYLDITNMEMKGSMANFDFKFEELRTDLGELELAEQLNFSMDSNRIIIQASQDQSGVLALRNLKLGDILNESLLGQVNGNIRPMIEIDNSGKVAVYIEESRLSNVGFNGYSIAQIALGETRYVNEKLTTSLKISDKHVKLDLSCSLDLRNKMDLEGRLNVELVDLDALNFTNDSSKLATSVSIDLKGKSFSDYSGDITAEFVKYSKGVDDLEIPKLLFSIRSTKEMQEYNLNSSIIDVELSGKFDWENLLTDFTNDLAAVFPTLNVGGGSGNSTRRKNAINDIEFKILSKDMDRVFSMFVSDLEIADDTGISGSYNSSKEYLDILFSSPRISIGKLEINDIFGNQRISNDSIFSDYIVDHLVYNDSLRFNQIEFFTDGTEGMLNSILTWSPGTDEESQIHWDTKIHDRDHLEMVLQPSFFTIAGYTWNIVNESDISITTEDININSFELKRDEQLIGVNGCLSENDFDKLRFNLQELDISEIATILGLENKLEGVLSGWGSLSNPYVDFQYMGDLSLDRFFVDDHEIGDLLVQTNWSPSNNAINVLGELNVNDIQTFNFAGYYLLESDSLDLYLDFDDTDISFVNAFIDPEDVSGIEGKLNGKVKLRGEIYAPELDGTLRIDDAQAKLELLGVRYFLDGDIRVYEDSIALNRIPIRDEEGNTGSLIGRIYHSNFNDWNFDIQIDFENDISKPLIGDQGYEPLERFLVLNTSYKDGDIYFGKAYGRGMANIAGYANNLEITLDVETQKGSEVNIPMYGVSDIEDEFDFVTFVNDNIENSLVDENGDLSGLDLDLNFKVTPDATVKIIFDPHIGDQIVATGNGDLNITMDQYNEVNLTGTYELSGNSKYNFAMGIIKQDFDIEDGSLLIWTGDPYNANIDLVTSFRMKKVSLVDLSPEQMDNTLTNQEVTCYLNLGETLLKPEISFDIKSPNAPETGKALINRVVNDEDELSRQFFSLLLLRKFQPLKGTITAGGSAALDIAESQINALLGQVSENYDFNFNSALDEVFGENSLELGVSKSFLEDRLIISGSFGIENRANLDADESENAFKAGFIGDLFVEYLINEAGTFRATAFNQSNSNTLNENAGQFTQGLGVSYHEEFNNAKDFKLLQYFFDIFRPKGKKRYDKKNKKQTRIE